MEEGNTTPQIMAIRQFKSGDVTPYTAKAADTKYPSRICRIIGEDIKDNS
jgi:hypothetical protein